MRQIGETKWPIHIGYIWAIAVSLSSAETQPDKCPPPELGVTDVAGSDDTRTDTRRVSATVVQIDFNTRKGNQINDVGDVVRYTPGVSIPYDIAGGDPYVPYGNSGFASYRIRGVSGNRIQLTVDGIRQPPTFSMSGGMGNTLFDPKVYGGVEILKGAGSAKYSAGAMGGTVGFQSHGLIEQLEFSPRSWAASASTTISTANESINGLFGSGTRVGNTYLEATDSYTVGHERKNDRGNTPANPMDFEQNHLLIRTAYIPNEIHRFSVIGELFNKEMQTHLNSAEGADVLFVYSEATNRRGRVSFDYAHTPQGGWWERLSAKLFAQRMESESLNQRNTFTAIGPITRTSERNDEIRFNHDLLGGNWSVEHRYDLGAWEHGISYGAELAYEHGENDFTRYELTDTFGVIRTNTAPPNAYDPSDLYRAEVFVEDVITRGRWSLTGGLRLSEYQIHFGNDPDYLLAVGEETKSNYSKLSLSPSASVIYELSQTSRVWARYAHSLRNPTIEEVAGFFTKEGADIEPNPDLTAETANACEVGARVGNALQFNAALHYTFYKDFIEMVDTDVDNGSGGTILTRENVGSIDIYGTELGFDLFCGEYWESLDGVSAGSTLAWAYGYNHTDNEVHDAVNPLEVLLYLAFDAPSAKWGTRLSGVYRGKKHEVSDDWETYLPPESFVLDGSAYWNATEKISFELTIRNLLNEKYWLWANGNRTTHSFNEDPELAVQPGINGVLSVNIVF